MMKIRMIISYATLLLVSLFTGCTNRQSANDSEVQQTAPPLVEPAKISSSSYARSANVVDQLYGNLLEEKESLKAFEQNKKATNDVYQNTNQNWLSYHNNVEQYYSDAIIHSRDISDSLLKKKIYLLLDKSKEKYYQKISTILSLQASIQHNDSLIRNQYVLLKIGLTLPIIEKYQNDHLPSQKPFAELIAEQEKLLKEMKSLMKK